MCVWVCVCIVCVCVWCVCVCVCVFGVCACVCVCMCVWCVCACGVHVCVCVHTHTYTDHLNARIYNCRLISVSPIMFRIPGAVEVTLKHFLNRQSHLLHGFEARRLKHIPKVEYFFPSVFLVFCLSERERD